MGSRTAHRLLPGRCVGLGPIPEPGVLSAAVGDDGDETASVGGHVAHRLFGAQLGISYVEERGLPDQGHQFVPGGDVGDVVGGVAVVDPIGNGHRAIGRDGEDEEQLNRSGRKSLLWPKVGFTIALPPVFSPPPG